MTDLKVQVVLHMSIASRGGYHLAYHAPELIQKDADRATTICEDVPNHARDRIAFRSLPSGKLFIVRTRQIASPAWVEAMFRGTNVSFGVAIEPADLLSLGGDPFHILDALPSLASADDVRKWFDIPDDSEQGVAPLFGTIRVGAPGLPLTEWSGSSGAAELLRILQLATDPQNDSDFVSLYGSESDNQRMMRWGMRLLAPASRIRCTFDTMCTGLGRKGLRFRVIGTTNRISSASWSLDAACGRVYDPAPELAPKSTFEQWQAETLRTSPPRAAEVGDAMRTLIERVESETRHPSLPVDDDRLFSDLVRLVGQSHLANLAVRWLTYDLPVPVVRDAIMAEHFIHLDHSRTVRYAVQGVEPCQLADWTQDKLITHRPALRKSELKAVTDLAHRGQRPLLFVVCAVLYPDYDQDQQSLNGALAQLDNADLTFALGLCPRPNTFTPLDFSRWKHVLTSRVRATGPTARSVATVATAACQRGLATELAPFAPHVGNLDNQTIHALYRLIQHTGQRNSPFAQALLDAQTNRRAGSMFVRLFKQFQSRIPQSKAFFPPHQGVNRCNGYVSKPSVTSVPTSPSLPPPVQVSTANSGSTAQTPAIAPPTDSAPAASSRSGAPTTVPSLPSPPASKHSNLDPTRTSITSTEFGRGPASPPPVNRVQLPNPSLASAPDTKPDTKT